MPLSHPPCHSVRAAPACLALLLIAALAAPRPGLTRPAEPSAATDFVAMSGGRFAAAFPLQGGLRGLAVRFAKGQFGLEDTAEIEFGVGYPELTYDPVSDTLLLYRVYEDAGTIVVYAPEGRELHRLRTGESSEALALVPGAGLLAIGARQELSLVECRTGATLRRVALAGPGGRIHSVTALGGDQLLAHCAEDSGTSYVLLDWRAGQVLWRQPAEPIDWGGRGRVAADSTRIFTLTVRHGNGGATIASRSRDDGAPLASADLPGDWCWLFAVPGDPRLLFVSAAHKAPVRLLLLDPGSLAVVAEAAWPAGVQAQYVHSARGLGDGRILLKGVFAPGPGPLARPAGTCRQMLVELGEGPPRVRVLDELLAVDPNGQGWTIGARRLEVVGEVPWLDPVDLDVEGAGLPAGVRDGRRELVFGGGTGQAVSTGMRPDAAGDAAALDELLDRADLCFVGTITATGTHCLGDRHGPRASIVAADFAVDELLWGPDAAGRVYIEGFALPGCIHYTQPARPDLERFVPGRRYLVAARWVGDAFVVRERGLFALDADASTAEQQGGFDVPAPAAAVRALAARRDPASQLERADAVVRLGAVENRVSHIAGLVSQVYKGDDALCRVDVWAERGRFNWLAGVERDPRTGDFTDGELVLFLRGCGPGRYELLEGPWSVLLRGRDGAWARPGGLREPRAAAVLGTD